ncbi:hypothetical protein BWZ22_13450 [Seonamhaeicola sp. S2-3]|uniref:retropepsin-like aspartic protease family protein n=1 Tax=Seonamhaeicola sp. S2-3 TaxID=1936081 RepID=UPI000972C10F|nr:retropepsin-like aspartic protease [Seonamhaeicola sp. S2-3]APY12167.1 hypothetical protein BWZ22_13450 [Seonamhaeicola sp. S2-3]
MEKINGVYFLPCKVNNLPLKFILDTGASRVSISETEALFMIKNGYLNKEDMGETEYYSLANGAVTEGLTVNLKTIEIGGIILNDIKASIVLEQKAPLLLGQTVLEKLGAYKIIGNQLVLENYDDNSNDKLFLLDEKNGFKSIKIGSHASEFKNYESQCFQNDEEFVCNIINAPDELLTIFDKKMNALVLVFDIKTKLLKEIKVVKVYNVAVKTETDAKNSSTEAINDYTYLSAMYSSVLEKKPELLNNEIFDLAGKVGSMSYWDSKNISLSVLFELADTSINETGNLEMQYTLTVSYKKNVKTTKTDLLKKF